MNVFELLKTGVETVKNTVGATVGNNPESPHDPSTPVLSNPDLVPTGEVPAPPVILTEEAPVPDVPVQSSPEAPCMWNKDGTFNRLFGHIGDHNSEAIAQY